MINEARVRTAIADLAQPFSSRCVLQAMAETLTESRRALVNKMLREFVDAGELRRSPRLLRNGALYYVYTRTAQFRIALPAPGKREDDVLLHHGNVDGYTVDPIRSLTEVARMHQVQGLCMEWLARREQEKKRAASAE